MTGLVALRVGIFHNIQTDEQGRAEHWFGHKPGHRMVKVFQYEITAARVFDPAEVAEQAFRAFNGFPVSDDERRWAEAYYARRLRSLSMGDVVVLGEIPYSCQAAAWEPVLNGFVDVTHEPGAQEYGTVPWPGTSGAVSKPVPGRVGR